MMANLIFQKNFLYDALQKNKKSSTNTSFGGAFWKTLILEV